MLPRSSLCFHILSIVLSVTPFSFVFSLMLIPYFHPLLFSSHLIPSVCVSRLTMLSEQLFLGLLPILNGPATSVFCANNTQGSCLLTWFCLLYHLLPLWFLCALIKSSLLPFTGLAPVCPCIPCTREPRTGQSAPGVLLPGLSRGE